MGAHNRSPKAGVAIVSSSAGSDMVGFGVAFGPKLNAEAGFRSQHISNAGIKAPNPGSNFYTGYLRYRF